MAKILVIDPAEETRVPFLRGILTRSLQDTGLGFDHAYALAASVREDLSVATDNDTYEITTSQLRDLVAKLLRKSFGDEYAEAYQVPAAYSASTIMVTAPDGTSAPFSRAQHRRCLEACGLSVEDAATITASIYQQLLAEEVSDITTANLVQLTHRTLRSAAGKSAARRYLVLNEFQHSGRPLVILMGGVPGSGKSTIANEIAHRLENARIQSTDMLREVMRMMVPAKMLPTLHSSSFNAWETLPHPPETKFPGEDLLIAGYRAQADLVSVACEAVVNRALKERVPLILEGVHLHPSFVTRLPRSADAIVVPVVLAVLKRDQLRNRIRGRSDQVPDRRKERYLEHFDDIWGLQSHLLSAVDQCHDCEIAIIDNDTKEKTVQRIMKVIIDGLANTFPGKLQSPAD